MYMIYRHGKTSKDRHATTRTQKHAVTRCVPSMDTGYSRGSLAKQSIICLHFARGVCVKGHECMYLHRLPTASDDAHCPMLYDIFGREKHKTEREDNGGTGSYLRNCRTLFVYYGAASTLGGQRMRKMLATSFGEWGAIEDIHIVPSKCISFVRYKFRASAEFAKEAMMGQKLEDSIEDSLVVRWANDDPNARAIERVKREGNTMYSMRCIGLKKIFLPDSASHCDLCVPLNNPAKNFLPIDYEASSPRCLYQGSTFETDI